ncbi:MAG TPA: thioredoxin family protein [Burkholderiaceae bacterium]|nr:thioredoxin family protein [Burkholderiaceae bacterium]
MQNEHAPTRAEVDATRGPLVLEFGAAWCGICRGMEPLITSTARRYPDVRHRKVEDGPGQPLGRSFGVKLWPTLVFLREGREVARVVRPRGGQEIDAAFRLVLAQANDGGSSAG